MEGIVVRQQQRFVARGTALMELPSRFTQSWIERTLPTSTPEDAQFALDAMRRKGWTDKQLAERVLPYMPPLAGFTDKQSPPDGDQGVELPPTVTKAWLDQHLPSMSADQIRRLMVTLEARGWSAVELALSVMPHLLPKLSSEDATVILKGLRDAGMTDGEIALLAPGLPGFDATSAATSETPRLRAPVELPNRFTQAWIERTLPSLSQEDADVVLKAMRRKGWTEEQLGTRVVPHLPKVGPPPAEAAIVPEIEATTWTATPEMPVSGVPADSGPLQEGSWSADQSGPGEAVNLVCPKGHGASYPVQPGEHQLTCLKCDRVFLAWVRLRVKNQRGRAVRNALSLFDQKVWTIEYVTLAGEHGVIPPFMAGSNLHVRGGHEISFVWRSGFRKPQPARIVNHTIGQQAKVSKAPDLFGAGYRPLR